ncbi:MAG: biotin--[acetyl-CoA-carboxylase] ligase [Clostridium sp.]|nr:biotin--[acetyl-CoA-carboxylase] ligase [Clostridium sp.]
MREKILHILKEKEEYVSGQAICDRLGVSRTAVWKNIKMLKAAGYQIDSVNNKGYKLLSEPDRLSEEGIRSYKNTKWLGETIYYRDTMDSSNNQAKRMGEHEAENGTLVVTDCQTAGKGRRGHSWVSPRGVNCYFTVLLRPELAADRASMITLIASMALAQAIKETVQLETMIKWPNDVIANGKKLCGILTESSTDLEYMNYVVVGIGINCNQEQFPEEIREKASSICLETGKKVNRCQLLGNFLTYFERYYETFLTTEDLEHLKDEYNHLLVNRGREVVVIEKDRERRFTAIGINQQGALLVEDAKGKKETIISGEVSVRGIYGYV